MDLSPGVVPRVSSIFTLSHFPKPWRLNIPVHLQILVAVECFLVKLWRAKLGLGIKLFYGGDISPSSGLATPSSAKWKQAEWRIDRP